MKVVTLNGIYSVDILSEDYGQAIVEITGNRTGSEIDLGIKVKKQIQDALVIKLGPGILLTLSDNLSPEGKMTGQFRKF